jgi:hypothetical protein
MAGFLQVLLKSSFKKLLLGTGLWQHAKMSTSLKSPGGLRDTECKKGQLSHQQPIPYVPKIDIVTPTSETQQWMGLNWKVQTSSFESKCAPRNLDFYK